MKLYLAAGALGAMVSAFYLTLAAVYGLGQDQYLIDQYVHSSFWLVVLSVALAIAAKVVRVEERP